MKMRKLAVSIEKRIQIAGLRIIKLSERELSKQIKVSKATVHNTIRKFQKESTFNDRKKSNCSKISSNGDDHFNRKIASQYPQWQKEDSKLVKKQYCSCRVSIDFGLKLCRSAQKLRPTRAKKTKLLESVK